MIKLILFSILFNYFATVLCIDKELCDFNDEDCVTKAQDSVLKSIIAGNKSWGVESSEPLHVETININLSHNMNYTFTDVYLHGLADCHVQKFKLIKDYSWYLHSICPRLVLKGDYIEKGLVDSVPIDGKGKIGITYSTYHIIMNGEYETITGSDGKPHMNITNYDINQLDVKDNVVYEFTNVSTNNVDKSEIAHKYLNDNWKKVNDEIQYQMLQQHLNKFLNNINIYLVAVPKYEIFYKNP